MCVDWVGPEDKQARVQDALEAEATSESCSCEVTRECAAVVEVGSGSVRSSGGCGMMQRKAEMTDGGRCWLQKGFVPIGGEGGIDGDGWERRGYDGGVIGGVFGSGELVQGGLSLEG